MKTFEEKYPGVIEAGGVAKFCERIRSANALAIAKVEKRKQEWREKFPTKPFPSQWRNFNPNRFEPFLQKLEREAGI